MNDLIYPKWIDSDLDSPELFALVIVSQLGNVFTATYEGNEWTSGNGLGIQSPEYWMPLPPPKDT